MDGLASSRRVSHQERRTLLPVWYIYSSGLTQWFVQRLFGCLLSASLCSQLRYQLRLTLDRDVRPILSDKCFRCHGPDENERQTELRFDERESVFADLGGYAAVVAGRPDESELLRRITSRDPDEVMPPAESKLSMTPDEVATLRQWVSEGAAWSEHWSFSSPVRSAPPEVADAAWRQSAIDRFIYAGLAESGLAPSPRASKERLIRRVTLDLTGLPPSVAEIDAFLADETEDAYAQLVDRLLASEACAERLALDWLDLARYADSHGMHADGWRRMWPWRDWVIKAFHQKHAVRRVRDLADCGRSIAGCDRRADFGDGLSSESSHDGRRWRDR